MESKGPDKSEYPQQFYPVPHVRDRKDYAICKLRILTVIANELHGMRTAIEKVHAAQLKPSAS